MEYVLYALAAGVFSFCQRVSKLQLNPSAAL